jgi:hypothetical protein
VFRPFADAQGERWVCKNLDTCVAREEAAPGAGKLRCGCHMYYVKVFGHYHSPQSIIDLYLPPAKGEAVAGTPPPASLDAAMVRVQFGDRTEPFFTSGFYR